MPRLIYANFAAARKGQLREQAISLILNWIAGNLVTRHLRDKCIHVVAHQVELVHIILAGRVYGDFGWWQAEDQPSISDIDVRQPQHIA